MESTIMYFKENGFNVILCTTSPKGRLHEVMEKNDVRTMTLRSATKLKMVAELITLCKRENISFLHSHLQLPNLIASLASMFMKTHVFTVRHNSDVVKLAGSWKEKAIDKLINYFSPNIIAISERVRSHLISEEKVPERKIHLIRNGYDFIQYDQLTKGREEYLAIRNSLNCGFLLISPGRLIPTKRHEITIEAIACLQKEEVDVGLIILGDGPLHDPLHHLIKDHGLTEKVKIITYAENISDFFLAADAVVLVTNSEASNNSIKEAGYFEKPAIVCHEVGDFDDYISNNLSGILLPKEAPLHELIYAIKQLYGDPEKRNILGKALKSSVLSNFNIQVIGRQYIELQERICEGKI